MARKRPASAVGNAKVKLCEWCSLHPARVRFCGSPCRNAAWRDAQKDKPHKCARCPGVHRPKKPRPRRKDCEEAKALREMSRDELHLHRSRCKECQ